jgi:hypothetical protein
MRATWMKMAGIGLLLVAFGCRTPRPNLKPASSAEVYNSPPTEKRFNSSEYPKEAFNARDPGRRFDSDQEPIVPVKSSMPGTNYR